MNKSNARDYLPLVQALADGKTIQGHMAHSRQWEDMQGDIYFNGPASDYRIKPDPKEFWVNRYPDGTEEGRHASKMFALNSSASSAIQVCYREVIE